MQALSAQHPSINPLLIPSYLFLWSLDRKWVFRVAESMKYLLQEWEVGKEESEVMHLRYAYLPEREARSLK